MKPIEAASRSQGISPARISRGVVFALCLIAGLATAHAQTLYKYRLPNGDVTYSDNPPADNRPVERVQVVPQESATAPQRPDQQSRDRSAQLDEADAAIRSAIDRLHDAQRRLHDGLEPLPGERVGNAGGKTSRLRPEYFARVRSLENDVSKAITSLDDAYRARNELR